MEQEPKYYFADGKVINRASGEVIPEDEPIFIFRARDRKAVKALRAYADACGKIDQEDVVLSRVKQFEHFARDNPDRMKEPDTDTSIGDWTASI